MKKLTAVSLFAGVGGFDLAMERNGIDVVAAVEIDKHARGVLAKQFPNTKLFNDVMEVTGEQLRESGFIPERGIITGGFPCQDLSVAGKRLGFSGKRSSLFYQIARLAEETQAKWLVLENVPGLLTSQRGADMGAVVGTLVEIGYSVSWRVLDAQHFGVPQRRRRVFIVAERTGNPSGPAQVLFERESLRGDSETSRTQGQETAGSTRESPVEPTLYEPHHGDGRATQGVANTIQARMGTGGNNTPVLIEPTAFAVNQRDEVRNLNDVSGALQAQPGMKQQTFIAEPVIPIQGSMVGRSDTAGPGGKGFGEEDGPMFTLNTTDRHAVAKVELSGGGK